MRSRPGARMKRQGCEQVINGHLPVFGGFAYGAPVAGIAQGLHPQDLRLGATNPRLAGNPWQDLWVVFRHFTLLGAPSSSVFRRLAFAGIVGSRDTWLLAAWAGKRTRSVRQRTREVSAHASRKQAPHERLWPKKNPGMAGFFINTTVCVLRRLSLKARPPSLRFGRLRHGPP